MNEQNNLEHGEEEQKGVALWLKIFMAVNIIALFAFFVFEASNRAKVSEERSKVEDEQNRIAIEKALEQNPPPADFAGKLTEETVYTVNATEMRTWVHFNFAQRTVFTGEQVARDSADWDIAFRRAKIITNGGASGEKGNAAVAVIPNVDFRAVAEAPENGYLQDTKSENPLDTLNPALDKWYKYDFWTHQLTPHNVIYIIKTADGRYAKLQLLNYYCGTAAGCYTFRYVYQGNGAPSFGEPGQAPRQTQQAHEPK